MVIGAHNVVFENENIPHSYGELKPFNFTPYPKNSTIAKVFRETGFADELRSGVKNLYKYANTYGGSDKSGYLESEVKYMIIRTTHV